MKQLFFTLLFATFFATLPCLAEDEVPKCRLVLKIYDHEGEEFDFARYGTSGNATIWQRFAAGIHQGTLISKVVHCPDGTSWREFENYNHLRAPELPPGEYRVTFSMSRIYTKWEGAPGTSVGGSSSSHGRVDYVSGFGNPEQIYGWGISKVFELDGTKDEHIVQLFPEQGPKVRIRTPYFADQDNPDDKREVDPAAKNLAMRILREDNFPLEESARSPGNYGLPWYWQFDRMKPGKYQVHFYRNSDLFSGLLSFETGTDPLVDVFTFEVTEDGPNDFVFTPRDSLPENSPWKIFGTFRDEDGKPIPGAAATIDYEFAGLHYVRQTATADENGRYEIYPQLIREQFGTIREPETGEYKNGFRLQQGVFYAARNVYSPDPRLSGREFEADGLGASRKGDIVLIGNLADEELVEKVLESKAKIIPVFPGKPVEIDFTLRQLPPPPSFEDNQEAWRAYFHNAPTFWDKEQPAAIDFFREVVLPSSFSREYIDGMKIMEEISVRLEFDNPEPMLGEPVIGKFVVHNGSKDTISFHVGGDYRGVNRPGSFSVRAVDPEGKIIRQIPRSFNMGGLGYAHKLAPGESYAFRLSLPDWLVFEVAGDYTIEAARFLDMRCESYSGGLKYPFEAAAKLKIVPFEGEKMAELVLENIKRTDDRELAEDERTAAREFVEHIDSKRLFEFFVPEIRENNRERAMVAIHFMRYIGTEDAVTALKAGITLKDVDLQRVAAEMLAAIPLKSAVEVLMENQEHPNKQVRLVVVRTTERLGDSAASDVLRPRFEDKDEEVRKEARRVYQMLLEREPTD